MAVRIGHASGGDGGARGGAAGDQSGKEVKISNWYRSSWDFVARAKDGAVAQKIAAAAIAGANNPNIGYDQGQRNTLLAEARKVDFDLAKIAHPCETDCSAFVSVCVLSAGVDLKFGSNLPTTSNLRSKLQATGAFDILTDRKYLTGSDYLKAGDVLCNEGVHAVVVIDDGPKAGVSESDTIPEPEEKNKIRSGATYSVKLPLLQKGDSGPVVEALQQLLKLRESDPGTVDGEFGNRTQTAVVDFQNRNGLETDGKVGGKTWPVLLGL